MILNPKRTVTGADLVLMLDQQIPPYINWAETRPDLTFEPGIAELAQRWGLAYKALQDIEAEIAALREDVQEREDVQDPGPVFAPFTRSEWLGLVCYSRQIEEEEIWNKMTPELSTLLEVARDSFWKDRPEMRRSAMQKAPENPG